MTVELDAGAALGWRAAQHALGGAAATGVVGIAERVVATRAWPPEVAELAFAIRRAEPDRGAVGRALEAGELVQSYAFRGGSYVFTPAVAAVLLAVRTASRVWETRRWQRQIGHEIEDWEPLRSAVRERLADGPATRAEIAAHLSRSASLAHLADAAASGSGSDSLYKPLHWWGDIAFGSPREGVSTFRLLRDDPRWPGPLDVDDAGREAVRLYLRAYGPATAANLQYWLGEGLSAPRRRLTGWLEDLAAEVTEVDVDGVEMFVLSSTLDDIRAAAPTSAISLLPGHDPWVLGPGTADPRIVAPQRRALLSSGRATVLRGGFVVGTWRRAGQLVAVEWFDEAGAAPRAALEDAVRQLGRACGSELRLR
jgi:hypothetical protein